MILWGRHAFWASVARDILFRLICLHQLLLEKEHTVPALKHTHTPKESYCATCLTRLQLRQMFVFECFTTVTCENEKHQDSSLHLECIDCQTNKETNSQCRTSFKSL